MPKSEVSTPLRRHPLSVAIAMLPVSLFPVTLSSLDVVDIVRGGASVDYGPNNVGG
jgi:outer membrane receptor for Fe3+-dicitrate